MRRKFKFGLRHVFAMMVLVAAVMTLLTSGPIRRAVAKQRLEDLGARVYFDWQEPRHYTERVSFRPYGRCRVEPKLTEETAGTSRWWRFITERVAYIKIESPVFSEEAIREIGILKPTGKVVVRADWQGHEIVLEDELPGVEFHYFFSRKSPLNQSSSPPVPGSFTPIISPACSQNYYQIYDGARTD